MVLNVSERQSHCPFSVYDKEIEYSAETITRETRTTLDADGGIKTLFSNHYTTLSLKLDEEISKFVTSSFVIFVFGITRGLGCSSCHLFQMISLDSTAATMNLYFHYFIRKHEGQQYKLRSKITLIKSNLSLK